MGRTTTKKKKDKSKLSKSATPKFKRMLNATYVKSARRRSLPNNATLKKNSVFSKNSKKLIDIGLAESEWYTYRINALYDFKYQKSMLKRYQMMLKSIVEANISKKGPKSPYYNLTFEVEMQYFYNMAFTKSDFFPLKIIIDTEDGNENDVYFTGVLLSVDRRKGFMESERRHAKATILPLFLVAYTDKVFFDSVKYFLEANLYFGSDSELLARNVFQTTLEKSLPSSRLVYLLCNEQSNFSCFISPLKFTSYDLMWMLALFSPKNDQHDGVAHMEYASPFQELKTIQVAFDPYTIVEVWNTIMDPNSTKENPTIGDKQVYAFINCLEKHFFKIFKINLSVLELQLIRTSLATVTANHTVWLKATKRLYFVMRHLTHLAQETLSRD